MSAREIIARAPVSFVFDPGPPDAAALAMSNVGEENAHAILEALTAAGYRIVGPGEVDAAARAAYEDWIDPVRDLEPSWDDVPESHRDRLRSAMSAAIRALGEKHSASKQERDT